MAAILIVFSSTGLHDLLVWGLVAWALVQARGRLLAPWSRWYSACFALHLGAVVALTALAENPAGVWRDLAKTATPVALGVALPVLLPTSRRLSRMLYSLAWVVVAVAVSDLVRLGLALGKSLWRQARFHEPYLLNHPNVASMMAGIALLVFLVPLFMRTAPWRSLAWRLPAVALLGAYLLVMASRGPQLAFGIALVLCVFLLPGWKAKLCGIVVMAALAILVVANIETLNPRFAEKTSMKNFSERTIVWRHTWELARERWLVGYGYGKKTFEQVYYSRNPPPSRFTYPHCHHYWLAQFFHTGLVGTLLLALAWGLLGAGLVRMLWTGCPACPGLRPLAGTVLMAVVFIHAYGLGDFPDSVVLDVLLWLPGLSVALLGMAERRGLS